MNRVRRRQTSDETPQILKKRRRVGGGQLFQDQPEGQITEKGFKEWGSE